MLRSLLQRLLGNALTLLTDRDIRRPLVFLHLSIFYHFSPQFSDFSPLLCALRGWECAIAEGKATTSVLGWLQSCSGGKMRRRVGVHYAWTPTQLNQFRPYIRIVTSVAHFWTIWTRGSGSLLTFAQQADRYKHIHMFVSQRVQNNTCLSSLLHVAQHLQA